MEAPKPAVFSAASHIINLSHLPGSESAPSGPPTCLYTQHALKKMIVLLIAQKKNILGMTSLSHPLYPTGAVTTLLFPSLS